MSGCPVSLRAALVLGIVLWSPPRVASAQQADVLAVIDGAARRWGLAYDAIFAGGVRDVAGCCGRRTSVNVG